MGIAGGCPIALSDEHITTQLPYAGGDSREMSLGVQKSVTPKEFQFIIHTKVRIIQSQIHGIQFFDQALPEGAESYEAWVEATKATISDLVDQVTTDGVVTSWLASAAHQCQVVLHRPCSRNIAVSESSIIAAAAASIQLITSYMRTIQSGGFILTFELSNSAFQAGMVLLHALRNHSVELEQATLAEPGHEALEVLVQLLVGNCEVLGECSADLL